MNPPPIHPGRKRRPDRRFTRLQTALQGVLEGRVPHDVAVVDLSVGGCLVRTPQRPEPGTIVDLRCLLGAETFRAKTRVREASLDGEAAESPSYLVGLEFLRLSASDQDLLREFLETQSRRRQGGARPPS
jgi:c-di-GMP-binding flagellar brake protein YcgR